MLDIARNLWYNEGSNSVFEERGIVIPTYCFKTKDGVTVERQFPMGMAPPIIHVGRKVAHRDFRAEQVSVPSTAGWPMQPCIASGVNAEQAGELRKFFDDHGCPTEVTADGDVVYRSKSHRERALKCRNLHDRN